MNYSIPEKVIKLLIDSNLSNYKISKDTGISDETIANYKKGKSKPRGVNLKVLSDYFGINDNEMQSDHTPLFNIMDIKEKIQQYLDYKNISDYRFEKEMSLSKGYWNKAKNPSSDIIHKICGIYTDLSTDWLIRGEGEMLKTEHTEKSPLVSNGSGTVGSVIGGNVTGNGHNIGIIPSDTEKALARAQWEVEYFKKENKNLKEQLKQAIADKERALAMLDKALSK